MTEIDIDVRVGGKLPITVQPTSSDVTILQGAGRLAGWSLRDVNATSPKAASGSVIAPVAATTIVTLSPLAAGTYTVRWTVGLQGAAAAGDAGNFRLNSTSGDITASVNPGAAGEYPQPDVQITVPAAGFIDVYAIGVGTAGVTYSASITITPIGEVNTVCELIDGNNTIGESALINQASDTRDFGDDGIIVFQRIVLHVISGTVAGCVYVIPSRGSQ